MTSYATVAQFAQVYDTRLLSQLGSDSGSVGTVDQSNTILSTAIAIASGEVRTHALRGGIYTEDALNTLYASTDWALIGLTCDIAIGHLYSRRAGSMPDDITNKLNNARKTMTALKNGEQVFNVAETIEAGIPKVSVISAGRRANLNLVSDGPNFPSRRVAAF